MKLNIYCDGGAIRHAEPSAAVLSEVVVSRTVRNAAAGASHADGAICAPAQRFRRHWGSGISSTSAYCLHRRPAITIQTANVGHGILLAPHNSAFVVFRGCLQDEAGQRRRIFQIRSRHHAGFRASWAAQEPAAETCDYCGYKQAGATTRFARPGKGVSHQEKLSAAPQGKRRSCCRWKRRSRGHC